MWLTPESLVSAVLLPLPSSKLNPATQSDDWRSSVSSGSGPVGVVGVVGVGSLGVVGAVELLELVMGSIPCGSPSVPSSK